MRSRTLPLLVALGVVLAACGGTGETTTTSGQAPDSTSTSPPQAPEAVRLGYTLEPGTSFIYEVDFDQQFQVTTTGDSSVMGEEGIPGELTMSLTGTTLFTYAVAEGPEPGTFEITITGDLAGLDFTGTMDGEPADPEDVPDFAGIEPFETTIIVDDQGNAIVEGDDPDDLLGGLFGGLEGFGDLGASGLDPGRFFGPPLTDDEVTVGDSWTETTEIPIFGDEEPATTTVSSVVSRTDTLDGVEVLVIDTVVTTSAIAFDLAEFLIGMFEAFMPPDASPEDIADLDALTAELRFLFEIDPSESTQTTWFDPEAGVSRATEFSGTTRFTMDINLPDEDTGELVSFGMVMAIDQSMTMRLAD